MINNFLKQNKYHLIILLILTIITFISGIYLLKTNRDTHLPSQNTDNITTILIATNTEKFNEDITSTSIKANLVQSQQIAKITTSETTQGATTTKTTNTHIYCQENCINTTIKVNDTNYELKIPANATAFQAMNSLRHDSNFSFSGKDYPTLGFFMEEINGVKNDNKNNKYWIYYINGQSAQIGISNYKLNNNDLIEWKYVQSNF